MSDADRLKGSGAETTEGEPSRHSTVYVSITGLRVRSVFHLWRFWRHAAPAMVQAKSAPGCIAASARTVDGVHHTLSVWRSKADMMAYLRSGAHAAAMKAIARIGTGSTVGYETATPPDWEEALAIWRERSKLV